MQHCTGAAFPQVDISSLTKGLRLRVSLALSARTPLRALTCACFLPHLPTCCTFGVLALKPSTLKLTVSVEDGVRL